MKSKVDIYIINEVKKRRLQLDITQERLSALLNRSSSYISTYENGKNKYSHNHLNILAKVLECSPRDFLPKEPIEAEVEFFLNKKKEK